MEKTLCLNCLNGQIEKGICRNCQSENFIKYDKKGVVFQGRFYAKNTWMAKVCSFNQVNGTLHFAKGIHPLYIKQMMENNIRRNKITRLLLPFIWLFGWSVLFFVVAILMINKPIMIEENTENIIITTLAFGSFLLVSSLAFSYKTLTEKAILMVLRNNKIRFINLNKALKTQIFRKLENEKTIN